MNKMPHLSSGSGQLVVDYLARDRAFRGIGPKRAQSLFDQFGAGLFEVLTTPSDEIIEMIGEEAALCAAAIVEERSGEARLLEWLSSINADIKASRAIRLARAWGDQGVFAIQENPYLLLSVAGWKEVDPIALASGLRSDDLRRDIAAIEAVLQGPSGLAGGNTRVNRHEVHSRARRLLGRALASQAIEHCIATGGAIELGDDLQPPGAAWMEAETAQILTQLSTEAPLQDLRTTILPQQEINSLLDRAETTQGFSYTDKQRQAVIAAHTHRALALGGYAGSGKTTVLKGICDTLEVAGRRPVIVTLSGRAAQRAAEATGRPAMTVAKFLVLHDQNDQVLSASDTLIADEASMLSLVDIWRLLRRLGDASLILSGDPAQLAPIGFGLMFHILTEDLHTPKVILDRVMRQSEESGIPTVAEAIRNGILPDLPSFDPGRPGVSFIPCSREELCTVLGETGRALRSEDIDRDDMQIIAPTNREIDEINGHFHTIATRRNAPCLTGITQIAEGEPVIWTENDTERGLTNGSMGRISHIHETGITALLDDQEFFLKSGDERLLRLAYAISVHKAQGSQWPTVIVPVFASKILRRPMIYTALTRAQNQVIFLGDQHSLQSCLQHNSSDRKTGIPEWFSLI